MQVQSHPLKRNLYNRSYDTHDTQDFELISILIGHVSFTYQIDSFYTAHCFKMSGYVPGSLLQIILGSKSSEINSDLDALFKNSVSSNFLHNSLDLNVRI